MPKSSPHLLWPDVIRVLAIILVVTIHISSATVAAWPTENMFQWWTANVYETVARPAVVLFVLVSGALLLRKEEPVAQFFYKRFRKVLIPFLLWVVITIGIEALFFREIQLSLLTPAAWVQHYLLTGYWFMYLIIQLYAMTPALRVVIRKLPRIYIGSIGFLSVLLITMQHTWCGSTDTCVAWALPYGIQYMGYFIMGCALSDFSMQKRWQWLLLLVIYMLSSSWILFGTYYFTSTRGSLSEVVYQYTSVPVGIAALSAFMLLKNIPVSLLVKNVKRYAWRTAAQGVFALYFVHILLLRIVSITPLQQVLEAILQWPVVGLGAGVISTLVVSGSIVLLLRSSRWGRYLT